MNSSVRTVKKIFIKGGGKMLKHIPLKWSKEEYKYFNKKIPIVEKENWLTKLINKYYYWVILAILISATGWVWWKIWELHLIRLWLKSI